MSEYNKFLTHEPVMEAQMLIRKPVSEVFSSLTNPDITSKFWFTKSSGPVVDGANLTWQWQTYGVSVNVKITDFEQNKRFVMTWGDDNQPTTVEWKFAPQKDDTTFVTIVESGFAGDGDKIAAHAIDSMGGFSLLLAAVKAYLEHGIILTVTADYAPADIK